MDKCTTSSISNNDHFNFDRFYSNYLFELVALRIPSISLRMAEVNSFVGRPREIHFIVWECMCVTCA